MFLKLNLNPKEKKTGDCVIRAIACATNKSWEKVYQDLCKIGLDDYELPNSKKIYGKYLSQLGWIKMPMPKTKTQYSYRRMKLSELAEAFNDEVVIVSVSRHLTCIEKGTIVDTWNCGEYSCGNYWIKKAK